MTLLYDRDYLLRAGCGDCYGEDAFLRIQLLARDQEMHEMMGRLEQPIETRSSERNEYGSVYYACPYFDE